MDETTPLRLLVKVQVVINHSIRNFIDRTRASWLAPVSALLITSCMNIPVAENVAGTVAPKNTEFMLTFDDGPVPNATERVLDMLATLSTIDGTPVRAGFFLLADAPDTFWQRRRYYAPLELWTDKGSIAKYPDIARRVQQAGHVIGSHTTHHSWLHWPWLDTPKAVLAELTSWEAIAAPVLGPPGVRLLRPPYFIVTPNMREAAATLGYQIVMGESTGDATPRISVEEIKKKNAELLASWDSPYPCVLVFHDMRPTTYEHLDEIVTYLQQQGFRLVHFDPSRL